MENNVTGQFSRHLWTIINYFNNSRPGRTEKLKKGRGANIDKNEIFSKIHNKMSRNWGELPSPNPPPPLYAYDSWFQCNDNINSLPQ